MRARLLGSLRPVRRYSQAAKGHARCLDYFSLVANGGKGYQSLFIRELREFVKAKQEQQDWAAGSQGAQSTSLVLLASRDLASWLEDREFMSDFLGSLQLSQNDVKGKATVDVLSGVTDGLAHQRWYKHKPPASGISVLLGNENILPRLWEQEDTESSRDPDRAASVSFSAAAAGNPHNSNITIPLANTIFQNGRRSTLFATRYETDSTGHAAATLMREKTHQDIEITTSEGPNFSTLVTLIPLTPPRKIVAGLGNIVRQVEVNGKATPASKEIEALIPQLLGKRQSQSPVGVWAVVVPPHLVEDGIFAKLFSYSEIPEDQNISELQLFERNGKMLSMFHHYGFRIHKVLSGGGGWGAKQGLLSLDPDISYTRPDQDNIDDFIKAFEARNSGDSSQGIVAPGSYIIFCVEPEIPKGMAISSSVNRGWSFGVSEKTEYDLPKKFSEKEVESKVTVVPRYFSAMSADGLYLKLDTPGHTAEIKSYPLTTKLDVPNSYLGHRGY